MVARHVLIVVTCLGQPLIIEIFITIEMQLRCFEEIHVASL